MRNQIGFMMQVSPGLAGCFPAVVAEEKKVVVCLNRDDLERVWLKLPRKEVVVTKTLFMVNQEERLVVPVSSPGYFSDFILVLKEDLDKHLFEWAPGVFANNESSAVFPKE